MAEIIAKQNPKRCPTHPGPTSPWDSPCQIRRSLPRRLARGGETVRGAQPRNPNAKPPARVEYARDSQRAKPRAVSKLRNAALKTPIRRLYSAST